MANYPQVIEAGNEGNGAPLTLGDPNRRGDLFVQNGYIAVLDWDGDGHHELVDTGAGLFTFKFVGRSADGAPLVDRGQRWGTMSRSHQRDENDAGLCGKLLVAGDFDGDGRAELILGPRAYSKAPVVVLSLKDGPPAERALGVPLEIVDPALPAPTQGIDKWSGAQLAAFDWDGDGRLDLVAALPEGTGYNYIDPASGKTPEDQRQRYHLDGTWKGKLSNWTLHYLRNTGTAAKPAFTWVGQIGEVPFQDGGALTAVDPDDPGAGLLMLGYFGDLWFIPLLEVGAAPRWGAPEELVAAHGGPFSRTTNMSYGVQTAALDGEGGRDLFASDIAWNVVWCRYLGHDGRGRPLYDTPKKIKQCDPHLNGGQFSVPSCGDLRGTGVADLVVGSIEGYVFWYRVLSTNPLRFAAPERLRAGGEEIRRLAKPHPAAGYHWGSSQGPGDGFNGGYSNPVLVDWNGSGLLDLLVGDMCGLFDWYPNRGTREQPRFDPPHRLYVGAEPLFGPWRVQPGVGDFSGSGLPDIVTMDLDLELALYRREGRENIGGLKAGEKLRYEDGETIKTHGVYTPSGGDGRGRTKIQVVDWEGDGRLDLVLGVGPQGGSTFKSSYVLLCLNVGSNAEPVFQRPQVLLFNEGGEPLEFWRHGAHPALVDWDGDGEWEIVVGADMGFIWYFKPEHFGAASGEFDIFRAADDEGL